ncbi:MAG: TlyA family rRNA (cytidine-2'-O)-methyltransferase [Candidatus Solibacter sp.]|nr:TlyA family rRNA (cytidine-2'-O)-methyltransferase [Candidatus Solibacter sp.]
MKPLRRRLDQLLLDRGMVESREKAKALILAGQVLVGGQRMDKAGAGVAGDAAVEVLERLPYVSRGGYKLAGALDGFGIDVTGLVCADIGASTGGFTDCLLQRGAARVHAVDVGRGQLHWKLRTDARVVVHENVNARYVEPSLLGEAAGFACCDVSFISATLIIPVIARLLAPPRRMVVLVKPQFEARREDVGKGGIVRDEAVRQAACARVQSAAAALGFETSIICSPIAGAGGNLEYLLYGFDPDSRSDLQA